MSKVAYNFSSSNPWWKQPFPDGSNPKWSDAHVELITLPLTTDPRKSEGLLKNDGVQADPSLYLIANRLDQIDPFLKAVFESVFKKGNQYSTSGGDSPTPYGWASDFDDMSGWPVYASTATPMPSTV